MTFRAAITRPRLVAWIVAIACVCAAAAALAQRGGFGGRFVPFAIQPNAHYDGRFTFVRVTYETAPGGYWWRGLPS